ncbi:hypothetical protein DH2020_029054 [Rehmannia glutinosa]|uniref:Pectin acetylesterase n=1 Tax=Rehmannia glutinosa TaxID=99300 RepID=A0ABR0VTX4_REHGL
MAIWSILPFFRMLRKKEQGGGWCDTTDDCLIKVKKSPSTSSTKNAPAASFGGILSPEQTINPDFYNWNRVYIRYCDGSSFIGDVEAVDSETNLHYRGSRIFSAVIDELLEKGFKNAQNAILVGNSAGGLATMLHCDRFRALIPNAKRVKCISDSEFRNTFLGTLKEIGDRPSTGLFINSCYIHDYLFSNPRWNSDGSPRLDNKTIAQAIGDWYFERSIVKLIDTQPDRPLDCHLL